MNGLGLSRKPTKRLGPRSAIQGLGENQMNHVVAFTVNDMDKGRRNTETGVMPITGGPAGIRRERLVARKLCVPGFRQVCPVRLRPSQAQRTDYLSKLND